MKHVKYDGDWSLPVQQGPTIPTFDRVYRSMLYTQKFQQLATKWRAMPISAQGPNGSYVYEETTPVHIGGGILEWERMSAAVPPERVEREPWPYIYQFFTGTGLGEAVIPVTSRTVYKYYHTLNPSTIPVRQAYNITSVGGSFYGIGNAPDSLEILAEATQVTRWKGHIWEHKERFVDITALEPFIVTG